MAGKILITPNTGSTSTDPTIVYQGSGSTTEITQRVTSTGSMRFDGQGGTILSLSNTATGAVLIGTATDNGTDKVQVAGSLKTTGDITVGGNLTVNGTTTTINATTLNIADLNVTVGSGATNASQANGAGLTVGSYASNPTLLYGNTNDNFTFNRRVDATSFHGPLVGDVTGNVSGTASAITGTYGGTLTSGQITTALGFTPANSATSSSGTVTSISVVSANGISGTVATSTTTPAITLTLGAITPTSITCATDGIFGNGTGAPSIIANGMNSGLSGGASIRTQVGSSNVIILGNTSAVIGGAYDSTAMIYSAGTLNIAPNGTVRTSITTTGMTVSGTISSTSTITGSNLSGTNTGDQTITLTGDVGGSGTGSFNTTLANTTVTAGAYTGATFTVDSKGRITAASSAATQTAGDASANVATTAFVDRLRSLSTSTTTGTAVIGDRGSLNSLSAGLTIPSGVFNTGDTFSLYNNTAGNLTITQGSGATMYLAGTTTTGNRTLATHGLCSVVCVAANTFVISGAGLT